MHSVESQGRESQLPSRLGVGVWLLAALLGDRAFAQSETAGEDVTVATERRTALQAETLNVSATPDASPHLGHPSYVVGLGAIVAPVYDGSNKTKTGPYPYVDIRGLWDDRLFVSSLRGIGVNVFEAGPLRGGVTLNFAPGRTSSDDPRLRGLPDTGSGAAAGAFVTWSYEELALEMEVQNKFGSDGQTEAAVGASYSLAPIPRLHLSVGARATWGDTRFGRVNFGVTPAEAAQANQLGNPLTPYHGKAGLTTAGVTGVGLYQLTRHWGLVGRVSLQGLVGSAAKDSPLTQKTFVPSVAAGALYQF